MTDQHIEGYGPDRGPSRSGGDEPDEQPKLQTMNGDLAKLDAMILSGLAGCGLALQSVDDLSRGMLKQQPIEVRVRVAHYLTEELVPLWSKEEIDKNARANTLQLLCSQLILADVPIRAGALIDIAQKDIPQYLKFTIADVMSRAQLGTDKETVDWLLAAVQGEHDKALISPQAQKGDLEGVKGRLAVALARISPARATLDALTPLFTGCPLFIAEALHELASHPLAAHAERVAAHEFLAAEIESEVVDALPASERKKVKAHLEAVRKKAYPKLKSA